MRLKRISRSIPLTLEPSTPRYFINVDSSPSRNVSSSKSAKRSPSWRQRTPNPRAPDTFIEVRGFLGVDKLGNPVARGHSALSADYFHPPDALAPPVAEAAAALDRTVLVRGLAAAPINGVYTICGAPLTGGEITYHE